MFYWTNPIIAKICGTAGEMTKYLEKEMAGEVFLDFVDDKTKKQVKDWDALKDKMRRCFLNVTDAAKIQSLIISVNKLIETHSGLYAKLLTALRDDLRSLEVYAKKQRPETVSKFDEEKCVKAIKIIEEQCGLYQKHLNGIIQEKQTPHNVERIQRAKNKLSDLQNMIKFDDNKNPSEQLIGFNTKFRTFQKKYAKPDPNIENEEINKRFWRRIAYALLTGGIYAIVRGTHLGTSNFGNHIKTSFVIQLRSLTGYHTDLIVNIMPDILSGFRQSYRAPYINHFMWLRVIPTSSVL